MLLRLLVASNTEAGCRSLHQHVSGCQAQILQPTPCCERGSGCTHSKRT